MDLEPKVVLDLLPNYPIYLIFKFTITNEDKNIPRIFIYLDIDMVVFTIQRVH